MNRQHVAANTAVQVRSPADHPRLGQAGVTQASTGVFNAGPDQQAEVVPVKFDLDGATEDTAVSDIERLG